MESTKTSLQALSEGDGNNRSEPTRTTRSGRVSRPPEKLTLVQEHLFTQAHHAYEEYSIESARIIAMTMCCMNDIALQPSTNKRAWQFVQSYGLMKGLKKFGKMGRNAAFKEMKQLHNRVVFKPIRVPELTEQERRRAMESLIFLVEKKDGTVKGRTCANGSTRREYTDRDDEAASPPTATTESIIITGVVDAKKGAIL